MISEEAEKRLLKIFKQYDVENDILDYHAAWDGGLSEEENLQRLEKVIKILSSSKNFTKSIEANTPGNKEETNRGDNNE